MPSKSFFFCSLFFLFHYYFWGRGGAGRTGVSDHGDGPWSDTSVDWQIMIYFHGVGQNNFIY